MQRYLFPWATQVVELFSLREEGKPFDNQSTTVEEKTAVNVMKSALAVAVIVALSGCASLKERSGFDVSPAKASETEQPWQGHAVRVPGVASGEEYLVESLRNVRVLTVSLDPVSNYWLADGIQHLNAKGSVLYADVWRALVFKPDGQVIEASSILGDATGDGFVSYTMLPGTKPEEMVKWNLLRISTGGELVMTTKGQIIGMMSPDPKGKEVVDIEKLQSDKAYRENFFAKHPSPISHVADFSPDTETGKQFLGYLSAKYPASKKFPGANYLVSPEANVMARESPRYSYLDKFISAEGVVLGPTLAAGPIGAGAFAASFIYSLWHASHVPAYGSVDDVFTKPEVALAWEELMRRHVVSRVMHLEQQVATLRSALRGGNVSWNAE